MKLDARWGKKNTVNHHGYKNSIRIDHVATPANIHGSQMLPRLLDSENDHDNACADSAYSRECFEGQLSPRRGSHQVGNQSVC
jgi:IS5 family transposase